jgi:hypothetical protein
MSDFTQRTRPQSAANETKMLMEQELKEMAKALCRNGSLLFWQSVREFPCISERLVACGKPVLL